MVKLAPGAINTQIILIGNQDKDFPNVSRVVGLNATHPDNKVRLPSMPFTEFSCLSHGVHLD